MIKPSMGGMADLPTGTVTFLFTDIEGSTRLLNRLGDRYAQALEDHSQLLRQAFSNWHGHVIDTQGDSFFVIFGSARDAVSAAAESQRALHNHAWPAGGTIRVRMGLHTGEAELTESGYVGIDVHKAARIGHIGHGGQVLLSGETAALVQEDLGEEMKIRVLGEYMLKDFREPEAITQLVISGLPSDFPELKSLSAWPNNLPLQSTPFIGREKELANIDEMLADPDVRLVTIVGAGGMGKSRLAIAAGEEQLFRWDSENGREELRFPHGVYFVPLAPLDSFDQLLSSIARAVRFQFYEGVEPKQQIIDYFQGKQLLLIMDNFEHLIEGAGLISELLLEAPRIKVLVTSREKLDLRGEQLFRLGGMPIPDEDIQEDLSYSTRSFGALDLFLGVADRLKSGIEVSGEGIREIVEICSLVEGMPLGIELAAGWMEMLSPGEIILEIRKSLGFLKTETRDVPERHRSLRAVFDSTWNLLSDGERELFMKLSIFRGGFNRVAAEEVAEGTLALLKSLTSKSLLQRGSSGRFGIHELLRQYAQEKLDQIPEMKIGLADAHSEFFAEFMAEREDNLRNGDQADALDELDNVRAGWRWAVERGNYSNVRKPLQSMFWLFDFQGLDQDAVALFEWAFDTLTTYGPDEERDIAYADVLSKQAIFNERLGQTEKGLEQLRESEKILQKADAPIPLAWAKMWMSIYVPSEEHAKARILLEQGLAIYRKNGISWGVANALNLLGWLESAEASYPEAENHIHESLRISNEIRDLWNKQFSLRLLGTFNLRKGKYKLAKLLYEESLSTAKAIGLRIGIYQCYSLLGDVMLLLRDFESAEVCHKEALRISESFGHKLGIAAAISDLGHVEFHRGDLEAAKKHFRDALNRFTRIDDRWYMAVALSDLGRVALEENRLQDAEQIILEALESAVDQENDKLYTQMIAKIAAFKERMGDPERAAELASLVINHPKSHPFNREEAKKVLESLKMYLDKERYENAVERGKALNLGVTTRSLRAEFAE